MQSVVVTSSTMPVLRRFAAFLVAVMLSVPCSAYALQQQDSAIQRDDQSQKRHYGDFCAMFTPCPKLEIPDSVFQMNYFEDFGIFKRLTVAVLIICDSVGNIHFTRTHPLLYYVHDVSDKGSTLSQHLSRFFKSLVGTTKLRAHYVYCRQASVCACKPGNEVRHPAEGTSIYMIIDVHRPYGFIDPKLLVAPTGYFVSILPPEWKPEK